MLTTPDSLQAYKQKGKEQEDTFVGQLSCHFVVLEIEFYMQSMLKHLFGEVFEYLLWTGNQAE